MTTITNVNDSEELKEELSEKLEQFINENQQFNVQGSWTGEDGLTVSVLIDFGVEDMETGNGYVGSVSARLEENIEFIEKNTGIDMEETRIKELEADKVIEEISESDTYMDAVNTMKRVIRDVIEIPRRHRIEPRPEMSDIDVSTHLDIPYNSNLKLRV